MDQQYYIQAKIQAKIQLGQLINHRYYRVGRPNGRKIGFTAQNVSSGLWQ